MSKGRISKRSIDALQCPKGKDREVLWDDAVCGFGVVAFPSGKKVYVAQCRQNGRSRRSNIGEHGRLTPEQARSEAKKLLGLVETGADPISERKAALGVRTFKDVAEDFLSLHVATKRKGRTGGEYRRIIETTINPAIGSKRITDVRRSDIARLHGKLVATPYAANMTLAIVSALWNWAAKRDEVVATANPAIGIERYPEQGRERYLTPAELARLGDALRETQIDPFAAAAIRLLILTGARLREILDAKWDHVDYERGVIFLEDSKTGKKPVYLSAAALAVLAEIPRVDGNPYIVPGAKAGKPRAGLAKPWAAICKAAGLVGVRRHDLRHTFASTGAGASMGLPIIGKLLGHTQAATTHRYAHLDADPLRRAVDTIGATIAAAMGGEKAGNVVALPKGQSR
ncbi:tyrosine-type recombinase/integrase [Methylocella sp.]|jgi:integrase|uniref:tyrosine-type recombinase/integrase n=1 Tax=Methylocella sp. TaxID=1978226 RepID=UPI003C22FA28